MSIVSARIRRNIIISVVVSVFQIIAVERPLILTLIWVLLLVTSKNALDLPVPLLQTAVDAAVQVCYGPGMSDDKDIDGARTADTVVVAFSDVHGDAGCRQALVRLLLLMLYIQLLVISAMPQLIHRSMLLVLLLVLLLQKSSLQLLRRQSTELVLLLLLRK